NSGATSSFSNTSSAHRSRHRNRGYTADAVARQITGSISRSMVSVDSMGTLLKDDLQLMITIIITMSSSNLDRSVQASGCVPDSPVAVIGFFNFLRYRC